MTGQEYKSMLEAIDTPAELLRPETFIPAFQQPSNITRNEFLDAIHWRSIALGISDEDFEQAARAAFGSAGGDVFGRTEYSGQGTIIAPQHTPVGLSEIKTAEVEWLIPGLLPRGELSVLGADGGTGKGLWQAQLIACATTAQESDFFPYGVSKPCRALIFSGEDDPAKVLRPRLLAAGADVEKVFVETSDGFFSRNGCLLSIDSELMAEIIRSSAPDLVIVDPYQAFLPMDVKMAERNQMRGATTPLRAVLRETNSAGLLVAHSNKKGSVAGRQRLADSADLWDAARCVILMGRDRETKQVYVSNEKNSYAPECRTTLFTIEGATVEGVKTAVAVYQGATDKKDYDFIMDKPKRPAASKDEAKEAIISILSESQLGSMESDKLRLAVMDETGCKEATFERARKDLKASGNIWTKQIRQKDGVNKWYTFYRGAADDNLG